VAHSLSAKKRVRQNSTRKMLNRTRKSAVKTQIKKFSDTARQSTDLEVLENQFKIVQKKIDKLAAKGVIHRHTAARKKSQLAGQLNAAKTKIQST